MLMSGSSPLDVRAMVSMNSRCTARPALVRAYRVDSAAAARQSLRGGSWTGFLDSFRHEDQISKCFQAQNP